MNLNFDLNCEKLCESIEKEIDNIIVYYSLAEAVSRYLQNEIE